MDEEKGPNYDHFNPTGVVIGLLLLNKEAIVGKANVGMLCCTTRSPFSTKRLIPSVSGKVVG